MLPFILGIFIISLMLILYNSNKKLRNSSRQINGPFPLPLIGNAYLLLGNIDDTMRKILNVINQYGTPLNFWLGRYPVVFLANPAHVEKILSSNKITHKHDLYDVLKLYGGEGLISGSGPKWKHARKLNQPLYGSRFVSASLYIVEKHINICAENLDKHIGEEINIEPPLHLCIADMISDAMLGTKLDTQSGKNLHVIKALKNIYVYIIYRFTRPWMYLDLLYTLSGIKAKEAKNIKVIQDFSQQCFDKLKRRESGTLSTEENDNFAPITYEFLKAYEDNPGCLDDTDFRDNLFTLYAASEDTITAIAAAACVCFGMYPDCQEKAVQEVISILGSKPKQITYEDINKMTYLDMCVKETLRLFPIGPFIMRKATSDFEIGEWTIPSGHGVLVSIFTVHLNPDEWQKPMEFYPEHFSHDAVTKRHSFSFIPFSAGPRGCIGKLFAQTSIKVMLAHLLQRYIFEADGKYEDVFKQLKTDLTVRPRNGYKVRIRKRICD